MTDPTSSDTFLRELRADADTYRGFAELDFDTPEGRFQSVVIGEMDQATTTPLFLWLVSTNHGVPAGERARALAAIESWVIRRTLLRLTTKDINRFMVTVLRELDAADRPQVGELIEGFLLSQESPTRRWPTDAELIQDFSQAWVYSNIRQSRLRLVFEEVETWLRRSNSFSDVVEVPKKLSLEHVMPRGWRTFWDSVPPLAPEDADRRDWLVNTIGNLTLVTGSLNSSLSNRPWLDEDAAELREGGSPGMGKRSLIDRHSLLLLNRDLVSRHTEQWDESAIIARGRAVSEIIVKIWTRPPT